MKKRNIFISLSLASVMAAAVGIALSAKSLSQPRLASATATYDGQIAIEFQEINSGEYWDQNDDDGRVKFIGHAYNITDAGKMCDFWTEVGTSNASHRLIMSYSSSADPTGLNTKLDLYRLPSGTSSIQSQAIAAVNNGEAHNHAMNVSFGDMVYVTGWTDSAFGVKHYIGCDSVGWDYEWDNSLHNVKTVGSSFEVYGDVRLADNDNFKLITINNAGVKSYSNVYEAESAISSRFSASDNITVTTGARYSFFCKKYDSDKLWITDPVTVEADEYAQYFNSAIGAICAGDHSDADYLDNLQAEWLNRKTKFLALEPDTRALLTAALAKTAEQGGTNREQFAAKYDGIITTYGETLFPDFADRFESFVNPSAAVNGGLVSDHNVAIIFASVILSVSTIGIIAFAVIRKRKHQ